MPVRMAEVTLRAQRPKYCALSNPKLASAGIAMPSWQDALQDYVRVSQNPGIRNQESEFRNQEWVRATTSRYEFVIPNS